MRKLSGAIIISVSLILLLTGACTRSKLGPAPTLVATGQAMAVGTRTPVHPAPGKTVIAAATVTPIPTLTPTTPAGTRPPTPTATPGGQKPAPTPTPAARATATPTSAPSGNEFEYTVHTGDTLWGLAVRFGTTVEAIKERNKLTSNTIYKGQKLIIPGVEGVETVTHVVQPGENMFRIALKYGTTVEAIAAANNIINPNYVYPGQKLVIPKGLTAPGGGVRYHVVQSGETLSSIAMRYGTTPWKIAAANGISNIHFIYAGQTLRIP